MKQIHIHADAEGPFWKGGRATAGDLHCGWRGFLDLLEAAAGLTSAPPEPLARVGTLAERVANTEGFWSASAATHPVRVARTLLDLHDSLRLAGWDGQGGHDHLTQLWHLAQGLTPGMSERLDALAAAPPTPFADLHLHTDTANLPARWQRLLDTLTLQGFTLQTHPPIPRLGQRVLHRPPQARAAAREVAAWIRTQRSQGRVVGILGADLLLDGALAKAGLPRSGARASAESASAHLALLSLLPLLADATPHPERVLEFLLLPRTPLPYATWLADALHEWPAVNSPAWEAKLQNIQEQMPPGEFPPFIDTLTQLFRRNPAATVADFKAALHFLAGYARPRCGEGFSGADDWRRLASACSRIETSLATLGDDQALPFRAWCDTVREAIRGVSAPAFPAEAGLVFVDHPGQLLAPVDDLVWWNFSSQSESGAPRVAILPSVRRALLSAGIDVAGFEQAALRLRQEGWLRAATAATGTLLLVCPRQDAGGEELHPHPALDLFRRSVPDESSTAQLVDPAPHPGTARPPRPLRELGLPIPPRDTESPSGLESLFSCPMKWTLNYAARLREPRARPLKSDSLLRGSVFHHLIARMNLSQDPDAMAAELDRVFTAEVPSLAAHWCLPGGFNEAENARAAYLRAVRALAGLLPPCGGPPASETEHEQRLEGKTLKGRIDLLLSNPALVVDFKTGLRDRDKDLKNGTAVQLLAYALLVNPDTPPPVVFLIVNHARLLPGPQGQAVTPEDKTNLLRTWDTHLRELAAGRVRATGIPLPGDVVLEKSEVASGLISLPPNCEYCRFDRLCGRKPVLEKKP